MDRNREFIGFVKDNEIHYGSSHIRGAVNYEFHEDILDCDFMFHTHPYSRLFRTELGFMSNADMKSKLSQMFGAHACKLHSVYTMH